MYLPDDVAMNTNRAVRLIEWLEGRFELWGKPEFDYKSSNFWEFVFDLIKVWNGIWPKELEDWKHDRAIDLQVEISLSESVKKGFKKTMAFPPHLFKLLKTYWPGSSLQEKKFINMFITRYPIFRNSNYT